jgi:hypothetical protein
MNEDQIKLETRLMMLENLIGILFSEKLQGMSPEAFSAFRHSFLSRARCETFPGTDPSLSDHISAEYEANVEDFLSGLEEKLGLKTRAK